MSNPPLKIGPIVVTPDPVPAPRLPALPLLPGLYQARPLSWTGSVPENAGLDAFFMRKGVRNSDLTMTVIVLAATAQRNIEQAYVAQLSNIQSETDTELAGFIGGEELSELERAKKIKLIVDELIAQKTKEVEALSSIAHSFFGRDPLAKNIKLNAVDFVNKLQDWRGHSQPIEVYNNFIKSLSAAYVKRVLLEKIKILTEKSRGLTSHIATVHAKKHEESLRLADAAHRAGVKQMPVSPPNVFIDKNIEESIQIRNYLKSGSAFLYSWFYTKVRNKGEWDFKQLGRQYADFGNFHYGAVGTAAGISEGLLLRAAGTAQHLAGTSKEEFDNWWADAPYGDDPIDQVWIKAGIEYAKSKGL